MVVTQNEKMASGLDINGCVLSYFDGTANVYCYITLTTLYCSKESFIQCCHMKRYDKIFTNIWGVYWLLWDTVYKIKIKPLSLCHMDYFNDVLTTFLGLEHGSYIAVYAGSESSHISYFILICILKMNKGLTGLEQHEVE